MKTGGRLVPELVLDAKAMLGEGAWWDTEKKHLIWLNILGHELHFYDSRKKMDRCVTYPKPATAVVPRKKGGYIAAFSDGIYLLDEDGGMGEMIVNPEHGKSGNRFNDGKCDPAGRFWIGSMNAQGGAGAGALYRIDKNFGYQEMLGGCDISNGIVWNSAAERMYYTDTLSGEILAFDYSQKDGSISNRTVAYKLDADEGSPDGMTIDSEDMVWAAVWGGGKVIRIDPEKHEKLLEIYLPVPHVSSVAFGGASMTQLFITSARLGLSDAQIEEYTLSGGLFAVETGIRGTKLHRFGA